MSESALETTSVVAPENVAAGSPEDPFAATPELAPAEPELTDEQKADAAFYKAEAEWKNRFDPTWEHERIEFHGDYLAIHVPTPGALTAVSLGSGKYIGDQTRTDLVGKFMLMHLGPESYGQYMTRMMDPTEKAYGDNAFGDFITRLGEMAAAAAEASSDLD